MSGQTASTIQKIQAFAKLTRGWLYGHGVPPTEATIALALRIVPLFAECGFSETDAEACEDGEILLKGYDGERTIEVEVRDEGAISLLRYLGESK